MLGRGTFFRPERFGSYLLESFIGSDLIAELYKSSVAEPSPASLAGPVMIRKIVPPFTADASAIGGLLEVTRELARLTHRNILGIYDAGIVIDAPFVVLEHVNGWNLFSLVSRALESHGAIGVPSPQVALYVVREIVSGLVAAHAYRDAEGHQRPLLHGALCLQSVYVSYEGEVKITGFGDYLTVERRLSETATPEYMSFRAPEQIRDGVTTAQSDLFAIGVIMYQLLTGRRPFWTRSTSETSRRILSTTTALPSLLRSSLSPDVNPVVMKALAKNPTQRYQRASDLHRDLDALLLNNQPPLEDLVAWIRRASRSVNKSDSSQGVVDAAEGQGYELFDSQSSQRFQSAQSSQNSQRFQSAQSSQSSQSSQRSQGSLYDRAVSPSEPIANKESDKSGIRPIRLINPVPSERQASLTKIEPITGSKVMPKAAEIITKIPGARSLILADQDGSTTDSYGDPDADNTSAIISFFITRMREVGMVLGMENLNSIAVQSKSNGYVIKSGSSGVVIATVDPAKPLREAEMALDAELGAAS